MMSAWSYLVVGALLVSPTVQQDTASEDFHEEIYVNPLPSGHVNTYFQFTTRWHYGDRHNLHNTRLTPRPIAEILEQYDVKELHIRLTQGYWRYESWGYPVVDAAPGAEVWAWFAAPNLTAAQVDEQWIKLASTFSGILCASLNFIDSSNTVQPQHGFRPQFTLGSSPAAKSLPRHIRYSSLPRENVCTENLTPWKKLLPCDSRHGFASLLNSGSVHNTNYHSLALKVRTVCEAHERNCRLEFTETANLVHDPRLLVGGGSGGDFSLRRLFGQGLNGHCPLAASSKIYVNMNEPERYTVTPVPDRSFATQRGGSRLVYGEYDMQRPQDEKLFNIAWVKEKRPAGQQAPLVQLHPPPPLTVHRYILGRGQERGKIITQIRNNHYAALPVLLQESVPWFVPAYMHTLTITATKEHDSATSWLIAPKAVHYRPGVQRERPYHLEVAFELPAKASVQVAFDFDYIFLKWLEYPPDANHGHYLGAAVLSTQLPMAYNYSALPVDGSLYADTFNASRPTYYLELRTESLILSLPTPDFSMPYNVICLACTVVALAFGPLHSVTTKRMIVEQSDAGPQTLVAKVLSKLRFKRSTGGESSETNGNESGGDNGGQEGMHEKSE